MNLPVVWSPEADTEFQEAFLHYAAINSELALRFTYAVEEAVTAIATAPLRFSEVSEGRRRAGVRRFPYSISF